MQITKNRTIQSLLHFSTLFILRKSPQQIIIHKKENQPADHNIERSVECEFLSEILDRMA
ncbi:hypothetical protein D9754_06545 [Planomicrobium sp. Y74]|nr:hypothetical protein D9754_06545 [Planomicrobium sp. Y74]